MVGSVARKREPLVPGSVQAETGATQDTTTQDSGLHVVRDAAAPAQALERRGGCGTQAAWPLLTAEVLARRYALSFGDPVLDELVELGWEGQLAGAFSCVNSGLWWVHRHALRWRLLPDDTEE